MEALQEARVAAPKQNWQDIFFTARDGLRLYGRRYPSPGARGRPVLCLPGLTRNASDFHHLASSLADTSHAGAREVYAVDYRGRGRSAHDPDWRNYTLDVELLDVLDFMTLSGLHDCAVIGTSRGGLLIMLMAAMRPGAIGAVILNDIGPVIERDGLLRIAAYVGRIPLPANWPEAEALVRDMNQRQFPAVPDDEWKDIARQWFNDDHDRPTHAYDQKMAEAISVLDVRIPTLWPQFEALKARPTLVIRGALSDILTQATVDQMRLRHPLLDTLTVPGQGHAPLLRDRITVRAITDFLARADAHGSQPGRAKVLA